MILIDGYTDIDSGEKVVFAGTRHKGSMEDSYYVRPATERRYYAYTYLGGLVWQDNSVYKRSRHGVVGTKT